MRGHGYGWKPIRHHGHSGSKLILLGILRNPKAQTLNTKPETQNPKPQALNPKPKTLNPRL